MSKLSSVALFVLAVSLLAAAPSCHCNSDDEAATSQPAVASTPKQPTASPLAGSWSGSAIVPGQGPVAAGLTIDDRGKGTAVLTSQGITLTESFRIESFAGGVVEVSHRGAHYSLTAELDGATLYVELPVIGWTELRRRP